MLLDLIHGALTMESQLLQRAKHICAELLFQSKIIQCVKDRLFSCSGAILIHF